MEFPQPRPFGAEGRKSTHDFLSLYGHPQQDPRPSQGGYLKTHDFLQPLERGGKTSPREQTTLVTPAVENPAPHVTPSSVEHLLPGGIGTYSIGHISYNSPRVPKPEGTLFTVPQSSSTERNEENSNCSSYTGSGFTLWKESAGKRGQTGKENLGERHVGRDSMAKVGQWTSEQPSQSSSKHHNTLSSLSSSSKPTTQMAQSFIEMIKSAKGSPEEEDDEEEDFILKKENSPLKGELTVKVDGKCTDQKADTPRSKHSATEQRRRSKINDRFQKLRELIPHSDQKRDKASFLLEVIEYIQFLQEKVLKYEGSFQGWSHEPAKLAPWRKGQRPGDIIADQARAVNNGSNPAFCFATKLGENGICASPTFPRNVQNPVESDMNTATTFKAIGHCKAAPLPLHLQPNLFTSVGSDKVGSLPTTLASESDNSASQLQAQLCRNKSCKMECSNVNDKLKEHDLAVEGGTISISSVYSQGLLNTLTQALQSSGVDLTEASISVQIDLGKRTNGRLTAPSSISDHEVPNSNRVTPQARVACQDFYQAQKRLKTSKS